LSRRDGRRFYSLRRFGEQVRQGLGAMFTLCMSNGRTTDPVGAAAVGLKAANSRMADRAKRTQFLDCGLRIRTDLRWDACSAAWRLGPARGRWRKTKPISPERPGMGADGGGCRGRNVRNEPNSSIADCAKRTQFGPEARDCRVALLLAMTCCGLEIAECGLKEVGRGRPTHSTIAQGRLYEETPYGVTTNGTRRAKQSQFAGGKGNIKWRGRREL